MQVVKYQSKLITAIAAFTLSNSFIINFFNYNAMKSIGSIVSSYSLYIMTIIALYLVFKEKKYWKSTLIVAFAMYVMVIYERHIDLYSTVHEFESDFLIHGICGFVIGLTIINIKLFVRYIAILSAIYSLVLIVEPITHSILHMDEMLTGYLMTGLTINLILSYHTVFERNRFIFVLAAVSTVIITLFTARGCGLALFSAWSFFYFWDKKRKGQTIKKTLLKFICLCSLLYIGFIFLIDYILESGIELEAGSLLEKLSNGYVATSNGRDEVWELGIELLNKAPLNGIGLGADRTISEDFFVHNILLELSINFGIPLALIILISYWWITLRAIKVNLFSITSCLIFAQIFKTWIQLLFSSSYLHTMLPLMFILGLAMHSLVNKKYMYE